MTDPEYIGLLQMGDLGNVPSKEGIRLLGELIDAAEKRADILGFDLARRLSGRWKSVLSIHLNG
jgi:hypothetical protein